MNEPVTLKDVAKKLSLSVSTVGRALSDDPQISGPTKKRVRAAAAELGYVAHSAARAMRRGKSTLIGLIIPDIQNEFYGTLAKALTEVFSKAGLQLVLAVTEDDPASEEKQIRSLMEARVAGLVITASAHPTAQALSLLSRAPCVQLIRRTDHLTAPWFGIDEEAALFSATAHLLSLGHRKIGYVGVGTAFSTGRRRLNGYERALHEAGLVPSQQFVRLGPPLADFAASAFETLWNAPERPTAIIAAGARLTVGFLQMATERGVRIPEDLSFVGYGDAPWWRPSLTTVSLPTREIALACGAFLLRRIQPSPADASFETAQTRNQSVTFASSLVLGSSTCPLPGTLAEPATGAHA